MFKLLKKNIQTLSKLDNHLFISPKALSLSLWQPSDLLLHQSQVLTILNNTQFVNSDLEYLIRKINQFKAQLDKQAQMQVEQYLALVDQQLVFLFNVKESQQSEMKEQMLVAQILEIYQHFVKIDRKNQYLFYN